MSHKLLLINKYYHDKGPAGGVGRYIVQEVESLEKKGWEIIPFATNDEFVQKNTWQHFFVKAHDYSSPRFSLDAISAAISFIWNTEAATNIEQLIIETKPDIAHLHNIYHHLTPSIIPVLKKYKVPIIMTLHDMRLLCPEMHMLRDNRGCEECKDSKVYNAIRYKCVKNSTIASILSSIETLHQQKRGLYINNVDLFLCPSRFIRDKYISWGYPQEKLIHLPNFVDLDHWNPNHLDPKSIKDNYLYFGRISKEKGLLTLLDAQKLWETGHQLGTITLAPINLVIAGSGPQEEEVKAYIKKLKLQTVRMAGALNIDALRQALSKAHFSVLPSECYENGPMATLESLACSIPVVGTNIGGIPESIQDNINGIIVPPNDPQGLLEGLIKASKLDKENSAMQARNWVTEFASRKKHIQRLEDLMFDIIRT
ncbi:MAG: glycosyltransferase family 4 protein [Pseudomonadota bacterium]